MLAAEKGLVGVVQVLLDAGAKPDVQTLRGNTALGLAARNRQLETVRLLLRAGANPKLKDTHGATPLMETTDANIARALIRGGAEVNAADDRGPTPMMRLIAGMAWIASWREDRWRGDTGSLRTPRRTTRS
jgi:ankyrin repeat protein